MRAAVVVGCDGYGTANASLAGAVRDALAFWQWVCDPDGGGVVDENARKLLLSPSDKGAVIPPDVIAGPADKGSFETALHDVVGGAVEPRERLYVYFAGHGFSVDDDFTVQGALAFADFDRNRTDNSIVVTDLLSELSFTGFAEQILIFDACRNIPFEGRLRAGRISRPFDRVPGVTQQFCALATTALNRTSDGTSAEDASFSGCLMRALAGDGAAKIWNEDANAYVVRWDQMFEYVTSALSSKVSDDRLPRQLGERDVGDPVLAQFAADHFPAVNVALRVHPDDVASADLVVHDPPDEHKVTWTAPGPATVSLVPRDYIVVASAQGLEPERRRWPLAAYTDSTVDITFAAQHISRGVESPTRSASGPTTFRAPDAAMAVTVAAADGTRVESLGAATPDVEQSTTVVARVTAPDGRDGPPIRMRVLPDQGDDIELPAPPVDDAKRDFAERLELAANAAGLVDVGGGSPVWPAPSSLLAMAWAKPGFVPRRVLPALPDARTAAVVVIAADVTVHLPADTLVVDPLQQPFGDLGARQVTVDGRQLFLPNVPDRALIIDLMGSSPFAVPAPITADPDLARRIDVGYRYVANGRLRVGLELLSAGSNGDAIASAVSDLVARRLAGDVTVDASASFGMLTMSIGGDHPLLAKWTIAPHSAITIAWTRSTA